MVAAAWKCSVLSQPWAANIAFRITSAQPGTCSRVFGGDKNVYMARVMCEEDRAGE